MNGNVNPGLLVALQHFGGANRRVAKGLATNAPVGAALGDFMDVMDANFFKGAAAMFVVGAVVLAVIGSRR